MGRVWRWLAWSLGYMAVALAIAQVAHGADMDQLTSRSAASRVAAGVDRWLWAPYHWVGRQLGPDAARTPGLTPALLVANALAWGAVLAAAWAMLRRRGRGRD